jgi:amino acid adenylation domain-containing protein
MEPNVEQYELSPIQEGMLFHHLLEAHAGVDVEQIVIDAQEPLDAEALQAAWQNVVDRHAVLRTGFLWEGLAKPVQQVRAAVPIRVERPDQDPEDYLRSDRRRGFDLREAPLMRLALFDSGEKRRLVWSLHHILMDGRAFVIVLREVFQFYNAIRTGETLALPEPRSFREYIEWIGARDNSGAKEFWAAKLKGFTVPTPLLVDRSADAATEDRYGEEELRLPLDLSSRLREFAKAEGLTMNTLVQGAWALLLSRYSGEEDIVFGATKTTRRSSVPGADSMVGLFLATIPVRTRVAPERPVRDWLEELRAEWVSLRAHEHTPLVLIHEASAIAPGAPLFDTLVVYENQRFDTALRAEIGDNPRREFQLREQTNYALTLAAYGDPEILLKLEYDSRRFGRPAVRRMLGHIKTLLESVTADPGQAVSRLALLTDPERRQTVETWNRTEFEYPRDMVLHRLIEQQVERTPDRVAVSCEGRRFTYAQLNARANQIAAALRAAGVGPDSVVGVSVRRSVDMVAGLLAILKAGGAYLPLDPALPGERITYMAEDSSLKVLVTESSLLDELPDLDCQRVLLDDPALASHSARNVESGATPRNLAYVIYTSGSTGRPKGVLLPQSALVNLLWSVRKWFDFGRDDVLLAVTTISFDIAGVDLWLPLLTGARSVIASREAAANGAELLALVIAEGATFLQATPVTWRILLEAGWPGNRDLRGVCTGEAMPRELADMLRPRVGRLWNMYGPTETTIWSTGYEITGPGPVLIGRPVGNTTTYIVDPQLQPMPVGIVGELLLGGEGLARGYLNRPELTAEKFIPDPFSGIEGARLYRTGDLARYLPDGNIECLGRTDHQVKIRGFRIELAEIEGVLERHPAIRQAVARLCDDQHGKRLVAYLGIRGGERPSPAELRAFLGAHLPDYMIPAQYVFVETFPLTSSGKVNRLALPAPGGAPSGGETGYVAPRNELERQLCAVWAEVFGLERVGIQDDFFDLGGHSLLAVQLLVRLEKILSDEQFSLSALLEAPTIERFASWLAGHRAEQWNLLVRMRPGTSARPPFFCVHGAGGNVMSMRALAMAFPPDLPFYALQAKGLDGSEPFETVEETALCYVEEIQKVQPHGPYHLGGGCYGGVVAFEMARILEERGERVAALLLMDTYNLAFGRFLPKHELLVRNAAFYLRRLTINARTMASLRPGLWASFVHGRLKTLAWNVRQMLRVAIGRGQSQVPVDFGAVDLKDAAGTQMGETLLRVRCASMLSAARFVPKPYHGRAVVFVATQRAVEPYRDKYLGWGPIVRGGIQAIPVDGDHDSIFEDPGVKPMAERANAVLLEAQAEARAAGAH